MLKAIDLKNHEYTRVENKPPCLLLLLRVLLLSSARALSTGTSELTRGAGRACR